MGQITTDAPGERLFMLGNEAIARGAIEAGVQVVAGYPGTPSSEIVETLTDVAKELGIYVEWSVNEKVAFEVALAASVCGLRALATMKHVGVNVAHDSIMQASYMGVKGGLVLLSADDPHAWSSQNEQDSRYIAEQGYIPVLEPSSVQEAKDMLVDSFALSEQFGHPIMVRSVTRISHGRGDVSLGAISREKRKCSFEKDPGRLVCMPEVTRKNRLLMIKRFEEVKKKADTLSYNQLRLADGAKFGIIACGLSYAYTLEAIKWLGIESKVSVLKIGTPYPLPEKQVKKLLNSAKEILVVEELEPFVETHIKSIAQQAGISVKIHGKNLLPVTGELSTSKVTEAIAKLTNSKLPVDFSQMDKLRKEVEPLLPWRPPTLCPGCPHRASFYAINIAAKRVARHYGEGVEPIRIGDIGCYGLGVMPPLESVDISICMGGSFGLGNGFAHIAEAPVIAHLGDSTFFHSGIPPLINAVYNKANVTMVILDNLTTSMTGFQPNPTSGYTSTGEEAVVIRPEDIAKACGVEIVEVIDPFDLQNAIDALEKAIRFEGPSVVVSRRLCTVLAQREMKRRGEKPVPCTIDYEKCTQCWACINLLGCPAIIEEENKITIDSSLCDGCGICAQICPFDAITSEVKDDNDKRV